MKFPHVAPTFSVHDVKASCKRRKVPFYSLIRHGRIRPIHRSEIIKSKDVPFPVRSTMPAEKKFGGRRPNSVSGRAFDSEEIAERDRQSFGRPENEIEPTVGADFRVRPKTLDQLPYLYPSDAFYNAKEFSSNPALNKLDDYCKVIRVAL